IKFLVGGIQIAIRQEQSVAKIEIGEEKESGIIAGSDKSPLKKRRPAGFVVNNRQKAGVGCSPERPRTNKGTEGANRNIRKIRINGGSERVTRERSLYAGIEIC